MAAGMFPILSPFAPFTVPPQWAPMQATDPAQNNWYVYPDGSFSTAVPTAGAIGPFSLEEAGKKSGQIKAEQAAKPQRELMAQGLAIASKIDWSKLPVTTYSGRQGAQSPSAPNVATAAQNLAGATKPPVPQMIQPYGRPKGFGAFGEKDINW